MKDKDEDKDKDDLNVFSRFGNNIAFVQDELKDLPELKNLPKGNTKDFTSKISYALSLGLKEKEIFFFGLFQWASIDLPYP